MAASTGKKRVLIPREHGAWGILLVPLFVGLGVAGRWWLGEVLLLGAVLFLYLARYPLVLWARSGFSSFPEGSTPAFLFFSGHGLFLGALLVFRYGRWLLVPVGVAAVFFLLAHLLLVRYRKERTAAGEFVGICALTLTAPAAFYVSSGTMPTVAFLLWFLSILYFGTAVFYVKMRVAAHSRGNGHWQPGHFRNARHVVSYQALVLAFIATLSYLQLVPGLAILAFLPLSAHVLASTFNKGKQLNIKRLGYSLVAHSLVFGLVLAIVYRLGTSSS